MRRKITSLITAIGAFCLVTSQTVQAADPCPSTATQAGAGSSAGATRVVNGQIVPIGPDGVGVCSTVRLGENITYVAQGPFGINGAFEGGSIRLFSIDAQGNQIPVANGGIDVDITPVGGVPLIGPIECSPISGIASKTVDFDIASHLNLMDANRIIRFRTTYGPQGTIVHTSPNQLNILEKDDGIQVKVAPAPTCTNPGDQTICQGGSATFTTTATGAGTLTYCWQKGCPGAGACLSTTASLSINNAQVSDSGCYTITVTDEFGCTTSCTANLTVNPIPSCTLAGPTQICPGSTHTYTSTVTPAGGTVTYAWSISGSGTINGSTTGASVSVTAGTAAPGQCSSFTLSLSVTRNNCPAANPCTLVVNFCQPSCVIAPASASLCTGASQQFCVTTSGTTGTTTITWTKNGAAFDGNSTCITAIAPAAGVTDTYVAHVVDSIGCTTDCQATLTGLGCNACIKVVKEIVCVQCAPDTGCAPFTGAKTATGAKGDTCPGFCYQITISAPESCTDVGVTLTNISVVDDKLGNLTSRFPSTLARGASASTVISGVEHCQTTVNIVTANATGVTASGATIAVPTVKDTNTAVVVPLAIECTKLVQVDGGTPENCPALTDGNSHSVAFVLTVRNLGEAPVVATITDAIAVQLGVTFPSNTVNLAVGGSVTLTSTAVTLPCETNINNTVSVTAVVDTSVTGIFACGTNHLPVSVTSGCSACYSCSTPQPASCRTTGGGKQDHAGVNVDPRANPLVAKYVTHGGQVGAPVGTSTEWTPCSPCIKGEWEHVRHFRPGLDGNFHARHFDSLQCACLPCEGDPGSGVITPGKKGGLCNAGDRVCGPEPRRAPANKMCFSGIGDYAVTNGRRVGQSVVFRVDIEDHGEPGGAVPKGNMRLPADR